MNYVYLRMQIIDFTKFSYGIQRHLNVHAFFKF